MSTLTKISVVVVFILALAACAVFYQEVATTADYKTFAEREQRRANLNASEARNQQLAADTWRDMYLMLKDRIATLERNQQNMLDTKNGEINRLSVQNAAFQGRLNELTAELGNLRATVSAQVDRNRELATQLDILRKEKIATENELRHAQEKLREQEVKIERLTRARRVLEEDISFKEQEIRDLNARIRELETAVTTGAAAGTTAQTVKGTSPADQKVEATVTAVKENLASLNVGSASGVAKGWVFILYRGAEFVGHLRIADVGTTTCAGIVFDAVKDVRVGDKATNKLE